MNTSASTHPTSPHTKPQTQALSLNLKVERKCSLTYLLTMLMYLLILLLASTNQAQACGAPIDDVFDGKDKVTVIGELSQMVVVGESWMATLTIGDGDDVTTAPVVVPDRFSLDVHKRFLITIKKFRGDILVTDVAEIPES